MNVFLRARVFSGGSTPTVGSSLRTRFVRSRQLTASLNTLRTRVHKIHRRLAADTMTLSSGDAGTYLGVQVVAEVLDGLLGTSTIESAPAAWRWPLPHAAFAADAALPFRLAPSEDAVGEAINRCPALHGLVPRLVRPLGPDSSGPFSPPSSSRSCSGGCVETGTLGGGLPARGRPHSCLARRRKPAEPSASRMRAESSGSRPHAEGIPRSRYGQGALVRRPRWRLEEGRPAYRPPALRLFPASSRSASHRLQAI